MNIPGEKAISKKFVKQLAPDISSASGKQGILAKTVAASKMKGVLDKALGIAADSLGAKYYSRVKDYKTIQQKIVQKRLEGRNYGTDDINDAFGGRIIINDKNDFPKAKKEIETIEKAGLFKINNAEPVRTGNYDAYHVDIIAPDGTKGEIQVHTRQSEAESLVNHDMRSIYGESPPPHVKNLVNTQADIVENLPNHKARAVSDAILMLHRKSDGKTINPIKTAKILLSKGGGSY